MSIQRSPSASKRCRLFCRSRASDAVPTYGAQVAAASVRSLFHGMVDVDAKQSPRPRLGNHAQL